MNRLKLGEFEWASLVVVGLLVMAMMFNYPAMNIMSVAGILLGVVALAMSGPVRSVCGETFPLRFRLVVIAYIVVFLLTLVFSPIEPFDSDSARELKWVALFLLLPPVVVAMHFFSGVEIMDTRQATWLKIVRYGFLGVLIASTAYAGFRYVTGIDYLRELRTGEDLDWRRGSGFFRNPIVFSHMFGGVFVACFSTIALWGRSRFRISMGLVLLLSMTCLFLSLSRGSWLAALLIVPFWILLLEKKWRRAGIGVAFVGGIIALVALLTSDSAMSRIREGVDFQSESVRLRLEVWKASSEILKDYPMGIGFSNAMAIYPEYYKELGIVQGDHKLFHAHNEFFEVLLGTGVIGFAIYMTLSVGFLFLTWGLVRHYQRENDRWREGLAMASFCVQVFISACAMTDQIPTPTRIFLVVCWIVALVLWREKTLEGETAWLEIRRRATQD